ncbi:MAG: hypothetical protein EXR48_01945 [Dehalococcoidia bacterium]|nr:hypothetical protein [Dehalococcoidia bacterium]
MAANERALTIGEVRALAKAAGLRLLEERLQQVQEELADLLPRLKRLEEAPVQDTEPPPSASLS